MIRRRFFSFSAIVLLVFLGFGETARAGIRGYGFLRRQAPGVGATAAYKEPLSTVSRSGRGGAVASANRRVPTPNSSISVFVFQTCDSRAGVIVTTSSVLDQGRCWSPSVPEPVGAPRGRRERVPRPSPRDLARQALDRAISLAPEPDLRIAPARTGLTGLDSYFWLGRQPRTIRATAGVPGLLVTAEASPREYLWRFGDGSDRVTSHSGRSWTERRPGNIAHLYERTDRYTVTVEVIWQARYRINGGAWSALGFFTTSDSVVYPVREMISVLVRPR